MTNVLHGFSMILEPYDSAIVTAAFKEWMQESSNMPTPADILKIVKRKTPGHRIDLYGHQPWVDKTPPVKDWLALSYEGKNEFCATMKGFPQHVKETFITCGGYKPDEVCKWMDENGWQGDTPNL